MNGESKITDDFQENAGYMSGLISSTDWPLYLEPLAKSRANDWVYDIDSEYRNADTVPKAKIRGSWKVDEGGEILPVFYPNPNYDGAKPPYSE